jgi:hypothetical protein
MYQQWRQNNNDYSTRWLDFAALVAREFNISEFEAVNILQRQGWFEWQNS